MAVAQRSELDSSTTRSSLSLRRQRWAAEAILIVVVALASLVALRGPATAQSFTIDESRWISTSRYFWTTFLERDLFGPAWQPNYLVFTQPPVARYAIGFGLWLQGWTPERLNGRYDSLRDRDFNEQAGNVPGPELLAGARAAMLPFAVGAVLLLYLIGRSVAGPIVGLIAAGLALANPLLSTLWTRALAEAPLAFFSLLTLWLALRLIARLAVGRSTAWLALGVGVSLGLATATKLSGALVGLGLSGFALLRAAFCPSGDRRAGRLAPWLGAGAAAVVVFVAAIPLLYPDPLGRAIGLFQHRREEMQLQQSTWPSLAVPDDLGARLGLVAERVFQTYPSFPDPVPPGLGLGLAVAGLGAIAVAAAEAIRAGRALGPPALLLCWALATYAGVTANLGFDSSHYYAPLVTLNVLFQAVALSAGLRWAAGQARQVRERSGPPAERVPPRARPGHASPAPAGPIAGPSRLLNPWLVLGAFYALTLLSRVYGIDTAITADEGYWMQRTLRFGAALARGDLDSTYRVGHPGVTVMWVGLLGVGPRRVEPFLPPQYINNVVLEQTPGYLEALAAARRAIVVATSLLATLVVGLTWKLLGPGPALIGGALLLLDPYLLGMTRILHVDALLTPLMTVSALAALIYWLDERSERYLLLSAVAGGLALLTKAPAAFLPIFFTLVGVATVRPRRGGWRQLRPVVLWGAAAGSTYVALWPTLWVNPIRRLADVATFALTLGGSPHSGTSYFFGQAFLGDPGPLYYPVALAFRLGPVALLGLLALLLLPWRSRASAPAGRWLAIYALLFLAVMTLGAKKLDRYVLPALVALDLLAGLGLWTLATRLKRIPATLACLAVPLAVQAFMLARALPYPVAFYNPLLGGAAGAERVLTVGWGEGLDQAAAYLDARPNADRLVVATSYNHVVRPRFRGTTLSIADPNGADYYLIYVNTLQRDQLLPEVKRTVAEQRPEFTAYVDGLPFAWVYRAPPLEQQPPRQPSVPDEEEG